MDFIFAFFEMTKREKAIFTIGILSILCMVVQTFETVSWVIVSCVNNGATGPHPVAFMMLAYAMLVAVIILAIAPEPCDELM